MNGFFDKVAVVTGAASGIGLGLAEHLLSRGARAVFMGDFNKENLTKEFDRLSSKYPGKVFPQLTDVTKREEVEKLIYNAKALEGHLDFVFNNAGVGMTIQTEKVTFEIWKNVMDLNFMGVVYGTYTAIPIMREQGFGHIVNTASIAGRVPVPYQAVYAASKSAVISMTESLQYELEVEGLNFSVICPGNIRTAIFGELTPPPNSVTVDEAIDTIFQELEKKSLIIILPQEMREYDRLYRENRPEFDKIARNTAAERRENYRIKGTYY